MSPETERQSSAGRDYIERVEGNVTIHNHGGNADDTADADARRQKLRTRYLHLLYEQARPLSLGGIDRKSVSREAETCLDLSAIYTALLTQSSEHNATCEKDPALAPSRERAVRQLSAVARLNAEPRLVLLGDPGSGKTTFVNFVVMCLAGEGLFAVSPKQNSQAVCANLGLLTAPLPVDESSIDFILADDEKKQTLKAPQPWDHGPLLPLRIVLRDFAARGLPPHGESVKTHHFWDFVTQEFSAEEESLGDYAPLLKEEFEDQGGLLLLDGLDEVPEAEERRVQIKQLVEALVRTLPNCRFVLTSRTYAYQQQDWRIAGFTESVLARFTKEQITRFVDHWYQQIALAENLRDEHTTQRARQLQHAILNNERLYSLAERPLLLTLMASLHAWRGGTLPEKRIELYKETVDLLLQRWEFRKFDTQQKQEQTTLHYHSLAEWLNVDRAQVLTLLNELAYEAHARQSDTSRTADIQEDTLVNGLMRIRKNDDVRPARLVEHLRDRAGLLIARGVGVYTFPHRTFQEYLAACYVTDQENYPDNIADLARNDPNRWREVLLLAAANAANVAPMIWALAETLCYQEPGEGNTPTENAWGALLAGQALVESAKLDSVSPRNRPKVLRLQKWLVAILTEQCPKETPFPAVERALAGNILAIVGDPRPGIGLRENGLPDIEWRQTSEHIAFSRYPVTNAQYRAFIDDGGYDEQDFWTEESWAWKKQGKVNSPRNFGGEFDLSNHPVVGVSWYEANAFCVWLTRRLRQEDELSAEKKIRLPSETEWEKAASAGGTREYPWGDEIDPERANYDKTEQGTTSTVGCFPRGTSFCGCEGLSGNVWEWCQDLYDTSGSLRVIRGGAWNPGARYCRAAFRHYWHPTNRPASGGFRLLRTPL